MQDKCRNVDITLNYILPKNIFSKKFNDLFSINNFGKKHSGISWTYIALKIESLRFINKDYDCWFYRSFSDIGETAKLKEDQVGKYIQVLIRLGLILAIKNPKKEDLTKNPGLKQLINSGFKRLPNKHIYFFKVLSTSDKIIEEAKLKAKDVNNWFEEKYQTKKRSAKNRQLRKIKEAGWFGKDTNSYKA